MYQLERPWSGSWREWPSAAKSDNPNEYAYHVMNSWIGGVKDIQFSEKYIIMSAGGYRFRCEATEEAVKFWIRKCEK